jgi:hypothetical protein
MIRSILNIPEEKLNKLLYTWPLMSVNFCMENRNDPDLVQEFLKFNLNLGSRIDAAMKESSLSEWDSLLSTDDFNVVTILML